VQRPHLVDEPREMRGARVGPAAAAVLTRRRGAPLGRRIPRVPVHVHVDARPEGPESSREGWESQKTFNSWR
jgi:hypothetical protein